MIGNDLKNCVIQIADYGGPYSGNFISSLLELERRLGEAGLRQVLIFSEVAKDRAWLADLRKDGRSIYILPKKLSIISRARRLSEIANKEKAVILHTHFTRFDVSVWLARKLLMTKKRPISIVWHVHSAFPIKKTILRKIKDILKLNIMGRSATIITVSGQLRQSLLFRGFLGRSHTLLNGIDIIRATTTTKRKIEIRRELKVAVDTYLLLSFGWDPITKGIDLLLKAAIFLSEEFKFTLVIVGDDSLNEFIKRQFGDVWPVWLRCCKPVECVADLYTAADIFISSSRWEGCPYSIMEAMSNGNPVITSNIPAVKWARESEGVVFFDTGDTNGLIEAIKKVITWLPQHDRMRVVSKSNRDLIKIKYSVTAWSQRMLEIYKKL